MSKPSKLKTRKKVKSNLSLTKNNYLTSYLVMKTNHILELPAEWQPIAQVFSALGDITRQKILLLFEAGEELSIKQIAETITLSRTAVVHHITVLDQAGILHSRKQGREVFYRIELNTVQYALDQVGLYISEMQEELAQIKPAPLKNEQEQI